MFDCSLVLVFEGKSQIKLIRKAIQELNAKRITTEERTVLVISKNLKEMKEFPIHKKFIPYVKMIVIPQEFVFGSNGHNPLVTFSVFVDKNNEPLPIERSGVNLIEKYIMVDDCADFNFLTIMAEKKEGKIRILTAESLNCSFTVDGEDDEECLIMDRNVNVEFLCSKQPSTLFNVPQSIINMAKQAFKNK